MDHDWPNIDRVEDRRPGLLGWQSKLGPAFKSQFCEELHEGECLLMSFEIVHWRPNQAFFGPIRNVF
jgi:hypothetical protein